MYIFLKMSVQSRRGQDGARCGEEDSRAGDGTAASPAKYRHSGDNS